MAIFQSAKFLPRIFNYSRNPLISHSYLPLERVQKAERLIKLYATAASVAKSLKTQVSHLNDIYRKGGEIRWRDVAIIKELLTSRTVPTSTQAAEIIRCCGNAMSNEEPAKRQLLLKEIITEFDKLDVQKTIRYYNALLKVYVENEETISATDFFNNLEKMNIKPNVTTYQHFISMACRRGDIDAADNIIESMQCKNMSINTNICNELILGHIIADDLDSANKLLATMKEKGLKPNSQTFANFLKGYAKVGDIAGIEKTFERFKEEGLDLFNTDVINAICELVENGHSNSAEQMMKHLRKSFDFDLSVRSATDRLIKAGHEELIPKMLSVAGDESRERIAKHCLIRMSHNRCSAERVNAIWKAFESLGFDLLNHLSLFEVGLRSPSPELIREVLKKMKEQSAPITEEKFWHLLRVEGQKGADNVLVVLKEMKTKYDINVSFVTLRDNVLPNFNCVNDPLLAIAKLRTAGLPRSQILKCVVAHCLNEHNIKMAYKVASNNDRFFWSRKQFGKELIAAFQKSNDVEHFVKFLRILYESAELAATKLSKEDLSEESAIEAAEQDTDMPKAEFLGKFLCDTIAELEADRINVTWEILNGLANEGLNLLPEYGKQILITLDDDMTPEISKLVEHLCSNKLSPRPFKKGSTTSELNLLSASELLELISNSKGGSYAIALEKYLLSAYIREENIAEAEPLIEHFESEDSLTNGSYAMIISMYAKTNNIDKALSTFDRIKSKDANFVLTSPEMITAVVRAMLDKNVELSKIEQFLESNRKPEPEKDHPIFNDFLHKLAEQGKADWVNATYELLVKHNIIVPTSKAAGTLVKVHIVNNNLSEALSVFKRLSSEIGKLPMKHLLYQKLIETKDVERIQQVLNIDVKMNNETGALYTLAFAFAESGLAQSTRNILEAHGFPRKPDVLMHKCKYSYSTGNIVTLKTLLEATRGLDYGRHPIFYYLLLIYERDQKVKEALDLWTQQKEENVTPSPEFELVLGSFLKANNIEPPFKVESKKQAERTSKPKSVKNENQQKAEKSIVSPLETYNQWENTKSTKVWSLEILSALFSRLIEDKHFKQANEIVMEMLAHNKWPLKRTFSLFLKHLATSCDLEVLDKLDEIMTEEIKGYMEFDKFCIQGYINGSCGEKYLEKLIAKVTNGSESYLECLRRSMPRFKLLTLLRTEPEIQSEFTKLAEMCLEKGINGPMNVLWMYRCLEANDLSAGEEIRKKYFADASAKVFTSRYARKCFQDIMKNDKLVKQLDELTGTK